MSRQRPTPQEEDKIYANKLVTPASKENQTNGQQKTQLVDSANQPLSSTDQVLNVNAEHPFLTNQTGTWGYNAGIDGSVTLTGSKKVIGIAAHCTTAGSMTINSGDSIPIPALVGIHFIPIGNIVDPTIVFTGTDSYVIEHLN